MSAACDEIWLPVVGYENSHEVSTRGRIKIVATGKIVSQYLTKAGRLRVTLYRPKRNLLVHRVMLEAFVGPCPDGQEACHEDDIGTHNDIENLRWDTRANNLHDRVRNGRHHNANKTKCPAGHKYSETARVTKMNRRQCTACERDRYERSKAA